MTVPLWIFFSAATRRQLRPPRRNSASGCGRWHWESCRTAKQQRNAKTTPISRSYLYAFLARITRHLALNCCRERKSLKRCAHLTELSAELEQCLAAPDNCAARVDDLVLAEAINGFLATLREEQRNIFLRRYWYLDSIAAIAACYSLSESKVKSTLFRCRNKFRDYLEKEGYTL